MTSQQLPDHDPFHAGVDAAPAPSEPTFGHRLQAVREARGLSLAVCAQALKLPVRVLRQLEADSYEGIDYQIYLGSYLTKYGRHLGLDESAIEAHVASVCRREEPALVVTGGISHSRYLFERYATAATYVMLTAVFVVPVVWFGLRGTLSRDVSHLAPLDAAPVAQQQQSLAATDATGSRGTGADLPPSAVDATASPAQRHADDDQPLLASMVPNITPEPLPPSVPVTAAGGAAGEGAHTLVLALGETSWVEVTGQDGERLEYGLLPAGTRRIYHSDQPLEVRLGNAQGAQVSLDGEPVALDAYRRANVAHFRIKLDEDGKARAGGV